MEKEDSPIEVDAFLCELAVAVCGVIEGLVLHHLHSFSPVTLLVAVFTDHIQLPDPVLKTQTQRGKDQCV